MIIRTIRLLSFAAAMVLAFACGPGKKEPAKDAFLNVARQCNDQVLSATAYTAPAARAQEPSSVTIFVLNGSGAPLADTTSIRDVSIHTYIEGENAFGAPLKRGYRCVAHLFEAGWEVLDMQPDPGGIGMPPGVTDTTMRVPS